MKGAITPEEKQRIDRERSEALAAGLPAFPEEVRQLDGSKGSAL